MSENLQNQKEHHKQKQFCFTRPAYRASRRLTAVKVFTVASESQHLFIYNVPKIKLRSELKSLCLKYGQLLKICAVPDCESEPFTECYWVQFDRIQAARIAKRFIDNRSFFGQVLHVCYAPEHENINETRAKLDQRLRDVLKRKASFDKLPFDQNNLENTEITTVTRTQLRKKRKDLDGDLGVKVFKKKTESV